MTEQNNINLKTLTLDDGTQIDIPFRDDGMINATALCKAGGKLFADYNRLKSTEDYLKNLETYTGISKDKLIITKKGNSTKVTQGTWVHRKVATHLAMWISSYFAVQVCEWIEEWSSINNNNEKYLKEIYNLKADDLSENELREKEIQLRLQQELGGEIEVETEVGYIDLLIENEIIEIKHIKNWKHAVGQILMYAFEYPSHQKRIHLFGGLEKVDEQVEDKCKFYDINITYE